MFSFKHFHSPPLVAPSYAGKDKAMPESVRRPENEGETCGFYLECSKTSGDHPEVFEKIMIV